MVDDFKNQRISDFMDREKHFQNMMNHVEAKRIQHRDTDKSSGSSTSTFRKMSDQFSKLTQKLK